MKKNLIKENYKKKIKLLDYYNQKYFNENISEITDAEFDELKREIISLENEQKSELGFLTVSLLDAGIAQF